MRLVAAALVAVCVAHALPAAADVPSQADEQAAKAHFLAGSAYYEQANYADAVKEFNEAHRLSRRPDLLYNVSVCYERMGRWDEAIGALQQYLVERPDAPDRGVIESRIANFTQRREADRAATAMAPAIPPPLVAAPPVLVPTSTRPRHTPSLVVGGIGLGLLVVALGTGVAAHLVYNDLNSNCEKMVCDGANQNLRNQASLGRALTISTDVMLGLGGATLITGVILFIVESRRPVAGTTRVQLVPGGGGLAAQF